MLAMTCLMVADAGLAWTITPTSVLIAASRGFGVGLGVGAGDAVVPPAGVAVGAVEGAGDGAGVVAIDGCGVDAVGDGMGVAVVAPHAVTRATAIRTIANVPIVGDPRRCPFVPATRLPSLTSAPRRHPR
jgi:hypothetical protein